ncbi:MULTISPECIES: glycosyltransferase [Streptococcus]|uniref:Glycosyltransferase n=1 Tax=Streptococcus caledonicus TaxID=2614158 RepID=A0ABW0UD78_9STRE|nr:glycosyltransferase [Streptococcus sp. S784/96/1]
MLNNKIVVLMTTYNPTEYIFEQIESILNQKGVVVELIIRDDASSEKKNLNKIKLMYPNITIIEGEVNLGVAENIKSLLMYASKNFSDYEFFAYSDQDDVWRENKLSAALSSLSKLNLDKPALYYANLLVTDSALKPTHELFKKNVVKNTLGQGLAQVFLFACTTMFNKNMIMEVVKYDFNSLGFDSLIYYIGIINRNIVFDNNPHILYRQHGFNVSGKKEKGLSYFISKVFGILANNVETKPMQIKAKFIEAYLSDLLTVDERDMVKKVSNYSGMLSRLNIIFDSRIQSGYCPKDIYRWLRLLMGNY